MADPTATPAPGGRGLRALGPGLLAFLAVDVVLVLVFLVLAVTAPDRGSPAVAASPTPVPESSPEDSAPAAPEDAGSVEEFILPSGNIWCSMTEDAATCTILSFSYDRPAPRDDCDGEIGQVLRVTADGETGFPCVEEGIERPTGLPELDYEEASTIGQLTCQSSERGVFCRHNPSQAGFSLARAGYNFF